MYDVLTGEQPFDTIVQECPDISGLSGAPATIDLAGAEIELVAGDGREYRLRRAIDGYLATLKPRGRNVRCYVLIDCPPSLGSDLNGLVAAREVLLPIQCEYYALEVLSQLLRTVTTWCPRNSEPRPSRERHHC